MRVSIHVPARGTTAYLPRVRPVYGVSIHVPARGTTDVMRWIYKYMTFQSTFPQGERQNPAGRLLYEGGFNPRSRKGNDMMQKSNARPCKCFNPRSRKGNDDTTSSPEVVYERFQSTFPQGERRLRAHILFFVSCVSIHVPARGTT